MTGPAVLSRSGLDGLIAALIADGYQAIVPTVRDDAIVLAEIGSGAELPSGWGVESAPGRYRLRRRRDAAVFGHSAGIAVVEAVPASAAAVVVVCER
jgi:hypothetical protein